MDSPKHMHHDSQPPPIGQSWQDQEWNGLWALLAPWKADDNDNKHLNWKVTRGRS